MIQPSLDKVTKYAEAYRTVPVYAILPEGLCDPTDAFLILKNLSRHCYILESLDDTARRGRYTFLGYDPILELTCADGRLRIRNGIETETTTSDPGLAIKNIIAENKGPADPDLPPFTGGLVGYFAYDYVKYSEPSLTLHGSDQEQFKDVDLMLFDKVIAYDHLERRLFLIINIKTDHLRENYNRAESELDYLTRLLTGGKRAVMPGLRIKSEFRSLISAERYCAMVEEAKKRIYEGDIFQIVLSNRLDADVEGSLFDAYRMLRKINPSPYMFYFCSNDIEIAGASPETLVRVRDGGAYTYPLAGTRPRGVTQLEDAALELELLADQKELAEHNMLVDLGRNDLGKVSVFGTVTVEKYLEIERYSHVMHIGSSVRGKLRPDADALDALAAVLPAGTLSGAPKIKACEIIHELESGRRGIYGGAIGYIGLSGNLDTCIAIRIAFKKKGKVFIRSGAGIVADSVPEKEYAECQNKMQAVVDALHLAEEEAALSCMPEEKGDAS
jgi:anthranilate synthase component 1